MPRVREKEKGKLHGMTIEGPQQNSSNERVKPFKIVHFKRTQNQLSTAVSFLLKGFILCTTASNVHVFLVLSFRGSAPMRREITQSQVCHKYQWVAFADLPPNTIKVGEKSSFKYFIQYWEILILCRGRSCLKLCCSSPYRTRMMTLLKITAHMHVLLFFG